MRQHFMHFAKTDLIIDKVLGHADKAYLLHFVDQGYDVWRAKLPWRLSARGYSPGLAIRLREATESADPETALRELYNLMHVFDESRLKKLTDLDVHFSMELDLDAVLKRHFPDVMEAEAEPVRYVA